MRKTYWTMYAFLEVMSPLDISRATHPTTSAIPATTTVGKIHHVRDLAAWKVCKTVYTG